MRQNRKQHRKNTSLRARLQRARAHRPTTVAGFTLFYALLVVALVMVILSHTLSVALREVRLASTSRDSQIAYYAAESSAECALYWVLSGMVKPDTERTVECNGQSFTVGGPAEQYSFTIVFASPDGSSTHCSDVLIDRTQKTIRARGYNSCDTSRTRVERGVEATY